jgi:hypothetical protein
LYLLPWRQTVSVCGSTPPTEHKLHAANRTQYCYRAIENAQAAFDLDREIDVSGCVDDVDAVLVVLAVHALPEACRRSRRYRNAAFLLLLHPVHDGGAVMDLAHFVGDACVKEHALRRGRFPRVNMGHDADIAVSLDGCCAGHDNVSIFLEVSVREPDYQR